MARWYLAFAAFAAALAVASSQPIERCWGTWAAIGYATAAVITAAAPRWRERQAALSDPGGTVQNAILFPLSLTSHRSPATSPLPGHLLATAGPRGSGRRSPCWRRPSPCSPGG